MMKQITLFKKATVIRFIILIVSVSQFMQCTNSTNGPTKKAEKENVGPIGDNAIKMLAEGKQTFRFETLVMKPIGQMHFN